MRVLWLSSNTALYGEEGPRLSSLLPDQVGQLRVRVAIAFLFLLCLPIVSIVVPFLVNQNLYYRILTIKLVNQKKELQWRL